VQLAVVHAANVLFLLGDVLPLRFPRLELLFVAFLLLGSTIVMAMVVVTVNRLVWRRLYTLGETRFRLES